MGGVLGRCRGGQQGGEGQRCGGRGRPHLRQWLADAAEELHALERLQGAHDAGHGAEHAGVCTAAAVLGGRALRVDAPAAAVVAGLSSSGYQ